ncbi:hypothetical protein JW960_02545 [candidate division KSB1 bacterium]|nr:hypothetical protein [candidate division KSB1 bacterium]
MEQKLYDVDTLNEMIDAGKKLSLAGDENALMKLHKGDWIAGTMPYFVAQDGGCFNQEQIFAAEIPDYATKVEVKVFDENSIQNIYVEGPENGFMLMTMPSMSPTFEKFAMEAPLFPQFAMHPLAGWVSGVALEDMGKITPKIIDGREKKVMENGAIVLNVSLPANKIPVIDIVNIFEQDSEGDVIEFLQDSYDATDVFINGFKRNFADYLLEIKYDIKCPVIADFYGALMNTSLKQIDEQEKRVILWCPVFKGVKYKLSKPVPNYAEKFRSEIPEGVSENVQFSCNCLLNYLYGELEGKDTAGIRGPFALGEIAYQLLNQTMVHLSIIDI